MSSIRARRRKGRQVRVGAPDTALTANAGLAAVTELCGRLGVAEELDAAVGRIKQRDRGFGAGELLCGIAAAQLAGEDFLTGLDRQRADAAGQQLTPVPGLASTTAAGLARRITPAQWRAVGQGVAAVTGRMLPLLPAGSAHRIIRGFGSDRCPGLLDAVRIVQILERIRAGAWRGEIGLCWHGPRHASACRRRMW